MSVRPGKGGQSFIKESYDKIKKLREMSKKIKIIVDGGINDTNIHEILLNGADNVVVGSYITSNLNETSKNIQKLISVI